LTRIGLIGCVKSKQTIPKPAADLYVSTLFRGRKRFVENSCDQWFTLSAKHGLIAPDTVIEPYDVTLKKLPIAARRLWANKVLEQLHESLGDLNNYEFEIHAGAAYCNFGLVDGLSRAGASVDEPTRGLLQGQQLAFYKRHNGGTDEVEPIKPKFKSSQVETLAKNTAKHITATPIDKTEIVSALLAFGVSLRANIGADSFSSNKQADDFIRSDPFAFLVAVICDEQVRFEAAWNAPLELKRRLGHWDLRKIANDHDAVNKAFAKRPALHRWTSKTAKRVTHAAQRVLSLYDGKTELLWAKTPTARVLQKRFEEFDGIGQKKAAMAVEILERDLEVPIDNLAGSDVAVDVHVRRVFLRTGLVSVDTAAEIISAARVFNPDRPGALDLPVWEIGRQWCKPRVPLCNACAIGNECPQLISQARGVSSA